MKSLCGKAGKDGGGGGKIHPAPAQEDPVRAAFRLLPSAILVLVVGLGTEARELLAYFVTCPLDDWLAKDAAAPTSARGCGGGRGGGSSASRRRVGCAPAFWAASHPPTFGCGCVDCYFSFWARWDRSPERDCISEALSAFEDHLAASAATTPPSSSKRREKGKRSRKLHATPPPPPPAPPLPSPPRRAETPEPKAVQVVPEPAAPLPLSCPPPPPTPSAPTWCAAAAAKQQEVNVFVPEPAAKVEAAEECREMAAAEVKRGWADVLMGGGLGRTLKGMLFNSPAVLSAT